ncbi:4-hydroxy-tetrahydrodipicolinate synthase [Candidatus Microgenomates bacterium]|nr:MAG: 4-hydroxy-tetrahydrodipicolinate synthase [Candidatus Microgenomates bacterium]
MKQKIKGAITAIVTPFEKNGKVDIKALNNLVEFQIKNNIDAIVPCGSTGEAATLNIDEYKLVVETVVKKAQKRVPIIAGAGSNDTAKSIHLSKIAKEAGADALLHVTPYYNKPTVTGLIAHFKAIANAVDLPIIVYNVPGRTGLNITADTTLKIAKEVPQVIGIKEASGNINQMMDILKGAPNYFSVLSGDDAMTYPLMAMGGVGCISVVSNEIPKEFSGLTRLVLEGNFEKAKKLHFEWLDLMNANFYETNPIPVKTALFLMGKISEVFRLPLVSMDEKNKEKLKSVLKVHKLI